MEQLTFYGPSAGRWSPLMQKATLGSKPDFPITTSINLVTLARESEDKGVGFASGLIAILTVCRSYWKLPRECMRNDGSKSLMVMLGSVELWSQHMFPYVLALLEDYTPSTHFLSTQAGAEGHRSVNERDKLNSPKMVELALEPQAQDCGYFWCEGEHSGYSGGYFP